MIIDQPNKVIFWFRRDLRLEDNHGLYQALSSGDTVIPIFIFDRSILDDIENRKDARVHFIYQAIEKLKNQLEELGTSLLVFNDYPTDIFSNVNVKAVYTNHDYEPYAIKRDKVVGDELSKRNIPFYTFKDQVIYEKEDILKADGSPYTVFTPYKNKWLAKFEASPVNSFRSEDHVDQFDSCQPAVMPSMEQLGFQPSNSPIAILPNGNEELIREYHNTRNFPSKDTTGLGVHLRFGTIGIRKLVNCVNKLNETFLSELIWREFFMMILWHFPEVENSAFKKKYDQIPWRNDEDEFLKWCNGVTGIPLVDAGMRQLNQTGFMHNRVRMVVASFLVKNLLIDWRWGEAYFAEKLMDFEFSSNNGNWQWAAGSGCDAAPYFRVFNPNTQADKFDKYNEYIKEWVPEYMHPNYQPMVDLSLTRERAISTYKRALA